MKQEQAEKIDRYIRGTADDLEREFVESLLSDGDEKVSPAGHHAGSPVPEQPEKFLLCIGGTISLEG